MKQLPELVNNASDVATILIALFVGVLTFIIFLLAPWIGIFLFIALFVTIVFHFATK